MIFSASIDVAYTIKLQRGVNGSFVGKDESEPAVCYMPVYPTPGNQKKVAAAKGLSAGDAPCQICDGA